MTSAVFKAHQGWESFNRGRAVNTASTTRSAESIAGKENARRQNRRLLPPKAGIDLICESDSATGLIDHPLPSLPNLIGAGGEDIPPRCVTLVRRRASFRCNRASPSPT